MPNNALIDNMTLLTHSLYIISGNEYFHLYNYAVLVHNFYVRDSEQSSHDISLHSLTGFGSHCYHIAQLHLVFICQYNIHVYIVHFIGSKKSHL